MVEMDSEGIGRRMNDRLITVPIPITAEALLYNLSSPMPLSTGIRKLDILLEGGMQKGEIIELYGKSNCGKTQVCHKILSSVFSLQNDTSGLYIDLHNDFTPSRFRQYSSSTSSCQDTVRVVRDSGVDGLLRTLTHIESELSKCSSQFFQKLRLVIIDALPFAFYTIMDPRNGRRIQENIVSLLRKLAKVHGITFIIVNHSVSSPEISNSDSHGIKFHLDLRKPSKTTRPALGKYWSNIPNIRISICRNEGTESGPFEPHPEKTDTFRATLEKSGNGYTTGRYFDFKITEDDIV